MRKFISLGLLGLMIMEAFIFLESTSRLTNQPLTGIQTNAVSAMVLLAVAFGITLGLLFGIIFFIPYRNQEKDASPRSFYDNDDDAKVAKQLDELHFGDASTLIDEK